MSSKETPRRRDLDNPDTVERAHKRIAHVSEAKNLEAFREDMSLAQGWIGALHVEGLLSKEQYEVLDAELDKVIDEWDEPVE